MNLTIADPAWLLIIALALPLGWAFYAGARSLPRLRRIVAIGFRVLLLSAFSLLLAGASSVRETDRLAVILVIDASGSVDRFATGGTDDQGRTITVREATTRLIRRLDDARSPDDLLGVVVFGGQAAAIATPTAASIAERSFDIRVADGTDIAGALAFASGLVPADAAGRILLVTDGNQTAGDAVEAAARVRSSSAGVRIDAVALGYQITGETIVQSLSTPSRAPSGATVPVRVEIASTRGTRGTLRLLRDGIEIDTTPDQPGTGRTLELGQGRHTVLLDAPLSDGRLSRFSAVFEPEEVTPGRYAGDTQLDNNAAEAFTLSPGQGVVLIVETADAGARSAGTTNIERAVLSSSREVRVTDASALPDDLLELQDYDLVILNDVPADAVAARAQAALAGHVSDAGAGLIMVGGRSSFGAGGWAGTPIEPLLPVHLDLSERLVERRTAIVFVLDSSGSMGSRVGGSFKSQQEIANAAAAAAAATLGPNDLVGAIAFSSGARWIVPLAENTDPAATSGAIGAISSGGGTNLPPALGLAQQALSSVEAAVKHVIVLSDGRSTGADVLPGIAESMAAEGINVSAISVGDGADVETMFAIADKGGGVHYPVTNPSVLPRVFVRAVRLVRDPLIKEGDIAVGRLSSASPLLAGEGSLPSLGGIVLTRFREDPTVVNVVSTAEDEPVLTHWNAGLGRVAAYTSDASEWSAPWIGSGEFLTLWSQLVQITARAGDTAGMDLTTEFVDGTLEAQLIATDDSGNAIDGLDVSATVYDPEGAASRIEFVQVGPGEYAGSIRAPAPGNYITIVRPTQDGSPLTPVLGGATQSDALEYRDLSPDAATVRRIADSGGGSLLALDDPALADLFDRQGVQPRRAESPIRETLLIVCLALLILDVAARRVAWDRFLGERRLATAAAGSTNAQTLESIRARVRQADDESGTGIALSDEDAALVAREARRQRAAARQAAKRPGPPASQPQPSQPPHSQPAPQPKPDTDSQPASQPVIEQQEEDEGGSGLLAAKRRARQRFEEDA